MENEKFLDDIDFIIPESLFSTYKKELEERYPKCETKEISLNNENSAGLRLLKAKVKIASGEEFELDFREIDGLELNHLQKDTETRDFTCNGLYFDFINGFLYDDFTNINYDFLIPERINMDIKSFSDLKKKILRWNPTKKKEIFKDATRYLRAIRISNKCNLKIEEELKEEIVKNGSKNIRKYDKNKRIIFELNKLMKKDEMILKDISLLFKLQLIYGLFKGVKIIKEVSLKEIKEKMKVFLKMQNYLLKKDYEDKRNNLTLQFKREYFRVLMLMLIIQREDGIQNIIKNISNSKFLFVKLTLYFLIRRLILQKNKVHLWQIGY